MPTSGLDLPESHGRPQYCAARRKISSPDGAVRWRRGRRRGRGRLVVVRARLCGGWPGGGRRRAPGIERQPRRRYAGFVMGGLRWQDLASIFERSTVR